MIRFLVMRMLRYFSKDRQKSSAILIFTEMSELFFELVLVIVGMFMTGTVTFLIDGRRRTLVEAGTEVVSSAVKSDHV